MSVLINASTSTGLVQSADTSGEIELQSNGTTALKVNTNEGIQILNCLGVGNATPSTSGAGITFPATQSASTDANTLDDYEEGTWTPSLGTDATQPTGVTYDALYRKGRYVKIGRMVFVEYIMILANKGTGGTGGSTVTGLPFAHSANDIFPSFTGTVCNLTTGRSGVFMQMNSGASNLVALYGNGGTATSLSWSDLANNSDFRGMLCYEASA
jgi:hypothetical protein